jgi:transposase
LAEVEIVGRVERRRKWTVAEKAALLAEVEAEGGKVKLVARRHRLSESLLYNWRSAWKAAAASVRSPQPAEFLSIGVFKETDGALPAVPADATGEAGTGGIEIILANGARLRVDALVDETALSRVLRALRSSV